MLYKNIVSASLKQSCELSGLILGTNGLMSLMLFFNALLEPRTKVFICNFVQVCEMLFQMRFVFIFPKI